MPFPLEGHALVMTGRFHDVEAEDARWALISKGARVLASVTKTTSAVIAGEGADPKILAAAAKHDTPLLGVQALRALMQGATLAEARTPHDAPVPAARPLEGRRAVVLGKPSRGTLAALGARLAALGATVTKKTSAQTDLLVLGDATFEGIDAASQGIDVLREEDVAALEGGAALATFLGRRDLDVADPGAFVASRLAALLPALVAIDLGGERWADEISLTVYPEGRVAVSLRELGGTPTEDHVRRVVQREDWPRAATPVKVTQAVTFG